MPASFRSFACLAAASAVALSSAACRTPSSKIPIDELTTEQPEEGPQGEAREVVEPLPVERPADMLPAEVPVLAEALAPSAVLGLITALDKYPEFGRVRSELRSRLGADVLDAEQWDELGLDSHGPVGVGMLDAESESWFAYLSLVDGERFGETLERFVDMAGKREELAAMDVGDARVYRLGREVSVVVRERIAMLLVVDDPERAPRDYVATAANIDPRESLGRSETFVWAGQQLREVDDGFVFVNAPELLAQIERAQLERNDYGLRYAQDELARARQAKESPQVIRELELRVEEERRWQRERTEADAGERALREAVFGSISAFVGAADLRADGIVGHGRLLMPEGGLLRRLFVTPEHESPLLTALGDPPVFALDGRVDLQVLLEAVELLARADGESLASVNRKLLDETGIDVIGGLIPALTGEGGLVVTQARAPNPKRLAEVAKTLGVAAHAGLRDAEAIRKLLDKLARDKLLGGVLVRAKRGDGWVLRVPNWHDVELTIAGDRLLVSTDAKLTARIRDAERGPLAASLTPEHPLWGPIPNPALRVYGRFVGAVLTNAHEPWKQDPESFLYDLNTHHVLNPDEAAKVPRSREFKRKLKELEAAVDDVNAFNLERAQREFERNSSFAEQLGDAGWQLQLVSDGIELAGQWRFAPGMTPLDLGYRLFQLDQPYDWSEYERVHDRVYTLAEELRQIRQADLDAAAAKRSK